MISLWHARGPLLALLVVTTCVLAGVSGQSFPIQIYGSIDVDPSNPYHDMVGDGVQPYYWVLTGSGLHRVRFQFTHLSLSVHGARSNSQLSVSQLTIASSLSSTHIALPTDTSAVASGMLSRMPDSNYLFACPFNGISVVDVTQASPTASLIWAPGASTNLVSCSVRGSNPDFSGLLQTPPFFIFHPLILTSLPFNSTGKHHRSHLGCYYQRQLQLPERVHDVPYVLIFIGSPDLKNLPDACLSTKTRYLPCLTRFSPPILSANPPTPASSNDWTQPWLVSSKTHFLGYGASYQLYVTADGTGYLKSPTTLLSFTAFPEPSSIPLSSPQSIGTLTLALSQTSSTALLVSTYRISVRSFSGAFEQSTNFNPSTTLAPAITYDGAGKSVFRGYCNFNGELVVDRTSFDPTLKVTNPTHYTTFATDSCNGFFFLPLAQGATDAGTKTFALSYDAGFTRIAIGSLYNCSAATSCTQCSILSSYCSWCATSTGPSCTEKAQCQSPSLTISTCPAVTTTTPAAISAEGTTSVTITGSGFSSLQTLTATRGGIYCLVVDNSSSGSNSTSLSKMTVFSDSLARCNISPLLSVDNSGATSVSLTFANSTGVPFLQSTLFSIPIYSCTTTSLCSDCASAQRPDCRWCETDSVCLPRLSNATCPTPLSPIVSYYAVTTTCALLQSITPSSTPSHFKQEPTAPKNLTIVADFPNASSGWSCVFGSGLATTTGTLDFASKTLSCPIAEIPLGAAEVNMSVQVKLGVNFFGSNSLFLRYYNCSGQGNCSFCLDNARPYCSWCLSSASCVGMATATASGCTEVTAPPSLPTPVSSTPSASTPASAGSSRLATCPTATISPPSIKIGSAATPVTLVGGPFLSTGSYSCQVVIGTASTTTNAATYVNTTAITCNAPALASYAAANFVDAQVTVLLGATSVYLGPVSLRYYSCSSAPNCSSCADPLHTACGWCMSTSSCFDSSSATCAGTAVTPGHCPSVTSVSPTSTAYQGGRTMTLTGAFAEEGDYSCWFRGPRNASTSSDIPTEYRTAVAIYNTTATIVNDTTITCPSPLIVGPGYGFYDVSVVYRFNSSSSFTAFPTYASVYFTNCLLMSNCSQCFAGLPTECKWCTADASCQHQTASTCVLSKTTTSAATCPTISNIFPLQAQAYSTTTVTIQGSNLADNTILSYLRCSMDGFNVMGITDSSSSSGSDQLKCPTHPNTAAGTSAFRLLTTAGVSGIFARYTDPSTQLPYNFNTYNCLSSTTCDACLHNANRGICGWCSAAHLCTDSPSCPNNATWSSTTCPRVSQLSRYQFDQTDFGTALQVSVSDLSLSGSMSLGCSFSSPDGTITYVNASSVSAATGVVTCPIGSSPLAGTVGIASIQVVNATYSESDVTGVPTHSAFTSNLGDAYNVAESDAEYIVCDNQTIAASTCGLCISAVQQGNIDSRCGWCVYEGACGISASCTTGSPLNAFQVSSSDCAAVTDVSPKSGPSTGNTLLTITGTGFVQSTRLRCLFGSAMTTVTFVSSSQLTCLSPSSSISSGTVSLSFSLVLLSETSSTSSKRSEVFGEHRSRAQADTSSYVVFATPTSPINFNVNYVAPAKKQNLGWIAAPVIVVILLIVAVILVLLYLRRRNRQPKLTPPDYSKYVFAGNSRLLRPVPSDNHRLLDDLVVLLTESNYALPHALRKTASSSDDELLGRSLIFAAYPNSFALDMLVNMIEQEVDNSAMEGELFRSSSLTCKMYSFYAKIVGAPYLWRTLARSIHTLDEAGAAEDARQQGSGSGGGHNTANPPSTGHVSLMDLGTIEVDPERLADKMEKDVDAAIMADIAIYQYELLLKTGRIFKKVLDSVDNVPRELRVIARRVKELVEVKYPENNMDYKGVCAFFFLRLICPAVMSPQVYAVLQHQPGETAQRYFVLISKTLQSLANDVLPSHKEPYMAKMDEFVVDNREALRKFVDDLCDVQDNSINSNDTTEIRLAVPEDIYYSSLACIHQQYMSQRTAIQAHFLSIHEEEFAQRVEDAMVALSGGEALPKPPRANKPKKSKKPRVEQASSSGVM